MASQLVPTTFEYLAEQDHESVLIKGSWDRWQSFAALQRADDHPNLWQVRMALSPGTVLFKFVVDNEWVFAPNYKHISDGFGGMNNALDIEPPEAQSSSKPDEQAYHPPTALDISIPSTYASIAEVTDVDVHHDDDQPSSAHHSPQKNPSSIRPQNEMQTDVEHEATSDAVRNGIPSEDTTQHVQPGKPHLPTSKITFNYPREQPHQNIFVKGSWDGWSRSSPLVEQHDTWSTAIDLPAGNFLCKFIVDDEWTHSPLYEIQSDGFGGFNNVISVPEPDASAGDTCQFYDALDSVLQPRQAVPEGETLSVKEKEGTSYCEQMRAYSKPEDVHPLAELNARDDESNTISSPPVHAEETAGDGSVPELESYNDSAPPSTGSVTRGAAEPSMHVLEIEEKLEPQKGSIDGETYPSDTPDTLETEHAERTIETLGSKAHGGDCDTKSLNPELGSQDVDASSEEYVEAGQAENQNSEKIAAMKDVFEEIMNDDERNGKKDGGCVMC
ncbi:protein kinase [Gracilaria domingensis]|nr:protein kinase [Gracilaria domingensis]